jgi:anaerobic magnesium-protoporphyrin IX monomethyl ester cyclase
MGGTSVKTTLVYAGIAGKGFDSLKQGMDSGWISHGLASLSACAKSAGFEIDLIDLRALSGWQQFREELARRAPAVLGLSMMSVDYEPVMEAVALVKELNPQIITVVGGPHPTFEPEEVLANPHIDYVVTGEGEITFIDLLRAIREGSRPAERLLPGVHPDLDQIPFSDHELFLDEWRRWGYDLDSPEVPFVPELPAPFVTIIAGRGCRYKCNFCKPGEDLLFGKGTRRRGVANVIAELKELRQKHGFASFMFHDDCLLEDRNWCIEFANTYRAEGFSQPFFCQSRADLIVHYEEMVKTMRDSGLRGLFIGFESGSDRVLRFIKKGTTRQRNLDAAKICKKYGITVWANYMLGLPTETEEEIKETISMLKEIDPDYYSPAFYTPHPGSELYDYCLENDLSLITSHKSYRRNPTELKIKGHDLEFLQWALAESQRRRPLNALKRAFNAAWEKYTDPRRYARKARRILGLDGGAE